MLYTDENTPSILQKGGGGVKQFNREFNRDEMTTILAKAVVRYYEADEGQRDEDKSKDSEEKAA